MTTFSQNLERFRIERPAEGAFDDAVVSNIEQFLPYRNEIVHVATVIAGYAPEVRFIERLHRFFEDIFPLTAPPPNVNQWRNSDFDNFKFIVHEMWLCTLAVLLKHERIEEARVLLERHYYLPGRTDYGRDAMVSYKVFRQPLPSLEHRNNRLNRRRLALHADMLSKRCKGSGIEFRHLMQADFVAFMRLEHWITALKNVSIRALVNQQQIQMDLFDERNLFEFSLKSLDLHIRPIHHRLADRVRAHILLCVLACYYLGGCSSR